MSESVNVERLRETTFDDPQFLGELVEIFLTDVAAQLVSLERAIASHDWPATSRAAHRVRGASGNVGADELARLCSELEHRSAAAQTVESSAGAGIRQEFDRVRSALQDCVMQTKTEGR